MPYVEDLPPNTHVCWPTPPTIVRYPIDLMKAETKRPRLEGEHTAGRSRRAIKVAQHAGVAGVRFILDDGQLDARTVAVVPGQPCG